MSISSFIEECDSFYAIPECFWAKQLPDGNWRYVRYDIKTDDWLDKTVSNEFFSQNFVKISGQSWKERKAA